MDWQAFEAGVKYLSDRALPQPAVPGVSGAPKPVQEKVRYVSAYQKARVCEEADKVVVYKSMSARW